MRINLLQFKEITSLAFYTQNILKNFGKLDKEDIFANQISLPELHFGFSNFHCIKLPVNPKEISDRF
jgi:arginine deiminase